ncbi:MAG: helix-turn-helix transcriptional regulator, partial [Verrucomicrobia bacterium]|nr:helix-turn-helix transcriptional regulator [Cytophagales bacterium]
VNISLFSYISWTLFLILSYTSLRRESFWYTPVKPLRWLLRILLIFGIFSVYAAILSFTSEDDTGDIYITTASAMIFYVLSFLLISQSALINPPKSAPEKKKYEKSNLDEQMVAKALEKLQASMEAEKLYLNSNLTLPELAEKLSLSTHHLSQLLNEQLGKNFFDFINEYRIKAMQEKLSDSAFSHFKIEEIAYDCGFNSKSVFNTAFKKFTGKTPSEYRKTLI